MAKTTKIVWVNNEYSDLGPMDNERLVKLQEMRYAGKLLTMESDYDPVSGAWTRVFIDQAAAQEFLDFLLALATKYNKPIVSAVIVDAV